MIAGLFFLLVLSLTEPALTRPSSFDFPVNNEKLKTGTPQLFQRKFPNIGSSKKRQIAAVVLINATSDQVWEVLENWDAIMSMDDPS